MKELNETIKSILLEHKNNSYAIDEKRYGFSLGDDDYKKVTGVDLETLSLEHGNSNVYGEVRYCKNDEGCIELQYETMVADVSQDALSGVIVAPNVTEDYLELFSTEQEETMDWSKYTKIVLTDSDNYGEVLGILLVEGMTEKEVWSIFDDVKYELECCWTVDDLITKLKKVCEQSGKECIWLTEVYSLGV